MIEKNENPALSEALAASYSEAFHADRANEIAAAASVHDGFINAAADYQGLQKLPYSFSIDLKQGSITNQKHSGRCWLFSALNIFRYEIIHRYDLEDFELSQNYMFFYDKLERCNYYLNNMIRLIDEPSDSRLFAFLSASPIGDGGQWDMMANIVRKYGVVPKNVYPDGANSIKSADFNQYLSSLLRQFTVDLRKAHQAGASVKELQDIRRSQMKTVYRVLCIALGEPPKTFDVTLRSKDGTLNRDFGINGKQFFHKYVGLNIDDYVSIINAPTADKPFGRTYTVKYLGNVCEGSPVKYLNLPIEKIKAAAILQLKDGHPVWFGSDCMKYRLNTEGVFDPDSLPMDRFLNVPFTLTKGERLTYWDSAMDHAMVFLGVNLNGDDKPDRWRIENSWGEESGLNKGYWIASDKWFNEYVYQIAINKKYLSPEDQALLSQPVIELEPWDPMGTLAD